MKSLCCRKIKERLENELWRRSPTSQLILQPFRRFTYVTAHSPILPSLYLRHSSCSNPCVALPTSQLILQPFRHFTYVTPHSPTLPSLYLGHSSFPNPSVTSPTSQLILQPFFFFFYSTGSSPTSPGEPPWPLTRNIALEPLCFLLEMRNAFPAFSGFGKQNKVLHHQHHHQCFAQGQVLHCKLRHQGCNSAQRQIFHCNLRNLGCSFTRDE